ncbi:MAG: hydroxyethylthiazole kinase [Eubacteriales bacterium]|nr:hydroxyethylthiazole kinase [Eubacteriales bacterium]MDD3198263.1 hydroxyethylthiazole kinase [Eubacteriales bacterium]MDD3504549.1 hydroxyethylthiazole kinase [Eubacteriales bacterium]MDD4683308.1 hydroxyethylthiazole kinase [Eubacteriales bacterium]
MLKDCLENVRKASPLIHNITNYVTVNDVANILLAAGASPIMCDFSGDVEEITAICDGLNINIGTLNDDTIRAMFLAGRRSRQLGHVSVLDPVGAGASVLRRETSLKLVKESAFTVIRGNISEIKVLALGQGGAKGVDASVEDAIQEDNLDAAIDLVKSFARNSGSIIAVTGAIDLISDGTKTYVIRNGRPEMARVTGTGCQLSGLTAAYLAANNDNPLEAAAAAVSAMGLAGEIAWQNMQSIDGNSTYRNRIIDAISNLSGDELEEGARYEIR